MVINTISFGRFTIDALPYAIGAANTGSNIDIELELLNGNRDVIGVYNDASTLNASIDTVLMPDTYYLRVKGKGNIYAPDYASLGSYTVNATFSPGSTLAVQKLLMKGTNENKQHKLDWEVVADENVITDHHAGIDEGAMGHDRPVTQF